MRRDGDDVFVTARPEWGPPWPLVELGSAAGGRGARRPPGRPGLVVAWAWIDEGRGTLRARAFGRQIGIAEDEATGSAATKLCAQAGRPVEIRQGRGSRIVARPAGDGLVEIGGRSALDEVRDYARGLTGAQPPTGDGSGRTITVSATGMISSAGRSAASACARIASGLSAA